uniref:Uncharacterized protein n=1 Tax=Tanacetum cinerariifolium TaxID=118510 RepID=A0A6L2J3H6_TANCI|nr:hypothetical protein [Tanacetum cinerariifolium]
MTMAATLDEAIFVRKKTKRIEDMTRPGIEKETWHSCVSLCDKAIFRFNKTLLDRSDEPIDESIEDRAIKYNMAVGYILTCRNDFEPKYDSSSPVSKPQIELLIVYQL